MGLIGINKRDSLHIAEGHALWVAVTIVTFHSDPLLMVEEGLAKGAGDNAGPASDAEIFVNDHPIIFFRFPVAGLCGADFNAVCLFTMIAGHGKIET